MALEDFFAMDEGSVEADTLCLGRETTFGTRVSWGTGNTVLDSFYPGLETECQRETVEGSISRHHGSPLDGRMQDISGVFSRK